MTCGIAGFGSKDVLLRGRGVHEVMDFHGLVPAADTPIVAKRHCAKPPQLAFRIVFCADCRPLQFAYPKFFERISRSSPMWRDV
jgi:hypothetical protein